MKSHVLAGAIVAASVALPVAAQPWYDPITLLHQGYVEVEGGATTEGRTKINIAGTGLGTSEESASQSKDFFGGALVGFKLAKPIAIEGEGFYARNNLAYSPSNAVFGIGGAERIYGGLGNLRLSLPFTPTYTMTIGSHTLPIGFEPYIAGGVGYGEVQYSGVNGVFSYKDSQPGFIYQGKVGLEVQTGEHIAFDLGYRYLATPDYDQAGPFNSPGYSALTRSHIQAATLGVKYRF